LAADALVDTSASAMPAARASESVVIGLYVISELRVLISQIAPGGRAALGVP